jgi:hypothetical protein
MVGSLMMTVMREKIIAEEIGMIVHVHQLEVHVIVLIFCLDFDMG